MLNNKGRPLTRTMKVLDSLHNSFADRCVDIFIRDDGTFGYEEYRREFEDGGSWYSLHRYSQQVFNTYSQAHAQAKISVEWLVELEC